MDMNELYVAFQNNILTDLKLVLEDHNQKIRLDIHKIVLYTVSPFFRTLLTQFRDKNAAKIKITVPYADVTYDIIMTGYGQKNNLGSFEYLLKKIFVLDYLQRPTNI